MRELDVAQVHIAAAHHVEHGAPLRGPPSPSAVVAAQDLSRRSVEAPLDGIVDTGIARR